MEAAAKLQYDPELPVIEAVQVGDRAAFAELVARHDRWVRGVILGVLGSTDRLDDVAQQVWVTAWERIGELRDVRSWRTWLYRLARNAAVDAGREQTRRRRWLQQIEQAPVRTPDCPVPESQATRRELMRSMLEAIRGLPPLYREPFVLRHLNGWSYQQIAELMGMPVDSIETRLVRARRLLRETLKDKAGANDVA